MAVYEGFTAGFECDDCEAPYGEQFAGVGEILIAVLTEKEWSFTVEGPTLFIFCPTCMARREDEDHDARARRETRP